MKAVLISIQPKWCELIARGKKTVEVRKTKPKIETPFKCYIYESKGTKKYFSQPSPIPYYEGKGKVIGEFVCDTIDEYTNYSLDEQRGHIKRREDLLRSACMTLKDWRDYIGSYGSDWGCAWHISNLIIYDKPKELSDFTHACPDNVKACKMCRHTIDGMKCKPITRPPQSWCYVEEMGSADV